MRKQAKKWTTLMVTMLLVAGLAMPVFGEEQMPAGTSGQESTPIAEPVAPGDDSAGVGTPIENQAPAPSTDEANAPGTKQAPASEPVDIAKAKITGLVAKGYTGKPLTQTLTLTYEGKTLAEGTDYELTYQNNVRVGIGTVIITGKGDYTGSVSKTFFIVSRKYWSFVWSGANVAFKSPVQIDNALSSSASPSRVWLTGQAKSIKISWTPGAGVRNIDGYILLRANKKGTYSEVARIGRNKTTYTDKNASKRNTWYAYLMVGYKWDGDSIRIAPCSDWVGGVTTKSKKKNSYSPKISSTRLTLDKGEAAKLGLIFPKNTYSKSTRWFSGNPNVATVDSRGVVIGVSAGKVHIFGRTANGRDVRCTVTVTNVKYEPSKYQAEINRYGKTFILIDISDQKMIFIKNGRTVVDTPVVTGQLGRSDTPKGTFKINNKLRNIWLNGPTWHNYVQYWMAFKGSSWGIHDASWRNGVFGGSIYRTDGSHGCVNTPTGAMKTLYDTAPTGTKVIIRQ